MMALPGKHPCVSLVVNTYQQAEDLPAALGSALAQSRPFDEIVVVDDGSTDDPAAVVGRYPAVRLVRQANAGLAAARNAGLAAATGDFVVFLDATVVNIAFPALSADFPDVTRRPLLGPQRVRRRVRRPARDGRTAG